MSNTSTATASASVAFPIATVLVVLLWVAKVQNLWGLGDLSWWLVFAPYWLGIVAFFGILLLVGVVVGAVFLVTMVVDFFKKRKRAKKRAALQKQFDEGVITANELRRNQRLL